MVMRYESSLDGSGLRIGVVVSRFNSVVTERLLEGALDGLRRHGVAEDRIRVASVPAANCAVVIGSSMRSPASGRW